MNPRQLAALIILLYGISLALPACRIDVSDHHAGMHPHFGPPLDPAPFKNVDFGFQLAYRAICCPALWLPNPLLWLGVCCLIRRRPLSATVLGALAIPFALGPFVLFRNIGLSWWPVRGQQGDQLYIGYHLWFASILLLAIAGAQQVIVDDPTRSETPDLADAHSSIAADVPDLPI